MSEVTYKKIVDVEQIDALGEGTTLFVNDGGSMKQMGAGVITESITGLEEQVSALSSRIAGINKAIPFIKQGDANYKCAITYAEAVALIQNGQNQANATLSLTNMDTSTMTLIMGCCYASATEIEMKMGNQEVICIRVSFKMPDGSVVKLQYNQDETITILNDAETEGPLTEEDVNNLIDTKLGVIENGSY